MSSNRATLPVGIPNQTQPGVGVPLPSSSGGTDYGDYYKYQQIQQIQKMQNTSNTDNPPSINGGSNSQGFQQSNVSQPNGLGLQQKQQPNYNPPQTENRQQPPNPPQEELDDENLVGVIKIKDGLFICDEYGAQDLEFIISNKVQRIVNTAGIQLTNHWDSIGVQYLTLNWQDDEKQILFDDQEKIPDQIYNFMNEALENHESVLIKSKKAQNRACFVIAAFIMRRYRWSMLKTLEFLNSRRQDLEMRPAFLKQLQMYENKLFKRQLGPKTQKWTEISEVNDAIKNEELILRNTYLNSQQGPWAEFTKVQHIYNERPRVLKWRDQVPQTSQNNNQSLENLKSMNTAGPLMSFMGCKGASQMLGNSIKAPQTTTSQITIDYPPEIDLLHKSQPQKQQNHYIFQGNCPEMDQYRAILRIRPKSASAAHVSGARGGISNKENHMVASSNLTRPSSSQEGQQKTGVQNSDRGEQEMMKQSNRQPQSVKNSHGLPPAAQHNNFMGPAQSSGRTSKAVKPPTSTTSASTSTATVQPRSNSTRVKNNQDDNKNQHQVLQNNSQMTNFSKTHRPNSLQRPGEEKLSNSSQLPPSTTSQSSTGKIKLSQQNIQQPRRREPTSRVAPKNQVSGGSGPNGQTLDNSILSTNMSFTVATDSAQRPSSSSQQQQKAQPRGNVPTQSTPTAASQQQQQQQQQHYPIHPSKKQQLRYQQQLNGRGYSPSYNNLVNKDATPQGGASGNKSGQSHVAQNYHNYQPVKSSQVRSTRTSNQNVSGYHASSTGTSSQKKSIHAQNTSGYSASGSNSRPGSAPKQTNNSMQSGASTRQTVASSGMNNNTAIMGITSSSRQHIPSSNYGNTKNSGVAQSRTHANLHQNATNLNSSQKHAHMKQSNQANAPTHGNQQLGNNHSMVIRNSNSLGTISGHQNRQQQNPHSKSILSSFRNGPIKVPNMVGGQPSGSSGRKSQQIPSSSHMQVNASGFHQQTNAAYNRVGQMNYGHASSNIGQIQPKTKTNQQPMTGQGARPGSAPTNKRPASPGDQNNNVQTTHGTQMYFQSSNQHSQNRVKYNKNLIPSSHSNTKQPVHSTSFVVAGNQGSMSNRTKAYQQQQPGGSSNGASHHFGPSVSAGQPGEKTHPHRAQYFQGQMIHQ